jgi:transposase
LAQRARIVLLAADGVSNTAIAEQVGVSRPTVIGWRDRYQAKGIAGLDDEDGSGRPRTVDRTRVVAAGRCPHGPDAPLPPVTRGAAGRIR